MFFRKKDFINDKHKLILIDNLLSKDIWSHISFFTLVSEIDDKRIQFMIDKGINNFALTAYYEGNRISDIEIRTDFDNIFRFPLKEERILIDSINSKYLNIKEAIISFQKDYKTKKFEEIINIYNN